MAALDAMKLRAGKAKRRGPSVLRTRAATLIVALALWEVAGRSGIFYNGVFPSILQIAVALARLLSKPDFYAAQLSTTAFEVAGGFAIGATAGLGVGLALGLSRYAGKAFEPVLYYVAPTPKIVFLPVLLAIFGVGPGSKIALGAMSCFFPMALNVVAGVRQVSPTLLRVGRSLRMTRLQTIVKIYLPALRPPIGSGLRISFGLALVGAILGELKLSAAGLGFTALDAYRQFDIATMDAVLIVVFALAALCNIAIGRATRSPGPERR